MFLTNQKPNALLGNCLTHFSALSLYKQLEQVAQRILLQNVTLRIETKRFSVQDKKFEMQSSLRVNSLFCQCMSNLLIKALLIRLCVLSQSLLCASLVPLMLALSFFCAFLQECCQIYDLIHLRNFLLIYSWTAAPSPCISKISYSHLYLSHITF